MLGNGKGMNEPKIEAAVTRERSAGWVTQGVGSEAAVVRGRRALWVSQHGPLFTGLFEAFPRHCGKGSHFRLCRRRPSPSTAVPGGAPDLTLLPSSVYGATHLSPRPLTPAP